MLTFSQLGRYGRFANGLFQLAGTIGVATKYGYGYGFPKWINHDHKDRFGSTEDIDLQKYFVNPLPRFEGQLPDFPVSWGYHPNLQVPDNVSLSGHFQSEKYFAHCMPLIRHYFRMKEELPDVYDCCAIHARLGDYDDKYHPRLTADYYKAAMAQFPADQRFTIFSDDLCEAVRIIGTTSNILLSPGGDYIQDFRIMKRFKHFITGNSSYSLMAAILGDHPDKKIVCPSTWWGPAWGPNYKELCKDVYPEKAIII